MKKTRIFERKTGMALEKLFEIIRGQLRWEGYDRSLEIATQAREVFAETSEGQRAVIEGIRKGESSAALAIRLRVSNPVTGAALAGPLSFQSKIPRSPERVERFVYPVLETAQRIEKNFERFYEGNTLYGYLFTQSCLANNFDPGAWLVYEQVGTETGPRLYPVEVSSEEAIYHEKDRFGDLLYLCFVRKRTAQVDATRTVDYRHWYIYGREMAAEAIEVKPGVPVPEEWEGMAIQAGSERISIAFQEYEINLPFVPAIQLGAYQDNQVQECNALFYQAAIPLLRDMMHKASTLHSMEIAQGFPKRFSYVKACNAMNEQGDVCTGGYFGGIHHKDNRCGTCNGTGKIKQSSELEEVELLWPEGEGMEAMIDLAKLVYDHRPPREALDYFNDKVNAYFRLVGALIFNQDLTEGVSMKTATEVNAAEQSITNHLRFMAEQIENAWEFAHLCAVAYSGGNPAQADVSMAHPEDFMIAPLSTVLEDLAAAKRAGASMYALEAIQKKALHRLYKNESTLVADALAFERHLPWRDKEAAVAMAIAMSRAPSDPDRVIFENFARIQSEVTAGLNGLPFSKLNYQAQKNRIMAVAEAILEEIQPLQAPEPVEPDMFNFEPEEPSDEIGL